MLEIGFGAARRIGREQHLAIVLPALILKAANIVGQVKHVVDALGRIVVPCGEDQQVRAFGDLSLVPSDRLNTGAHFGAGDHDDLIGLQAAGGGGQTGGFEDALDLVLRHGLGGIHLLGGVTPIEFLDQRGGRGHGVGFVLRMVWRIKRARAGPRRCRAYIIGYPDRPLPKRKAHQIRWRRRPSNWLPAASTSNRETNVMRLSASPRRE